MQTHIQTQAIGSEMSASQPIYEGDPVLIAYGLWKTYGNHPVVQGIQFAINPGEVLGLLGPNGAGKTTTVGMLYGAVKPSQGFVQVGISQVESDGRVARQQMGIVTQDDNLDMDFTVIENLIHFAHHYRIVGQQARQRAGEVLAMVNLENYAKRSPKELSGGMKRRLVLARALLNRPKVIFLDEPTTGLDPEARQDFWKIVLDLRQQGCGVLLTTHYMDEAQRLCDRLLLLQQGKVINEGSPEQLIESTIGHEVVEVEAFWQWLFAGIASGAGASMESVNEQPPPSIDAATRQLRGCFSASDWKRAFVAAIEFLIKPLLKAPIKI
jgi:lipooligosaccharide transport system ATP-binding protein